MRQMLLGASVSDSDFILSKKKKTAAKKKRSLASQNTKLLALAEQVANFGSWELDIVQTEAGAIWSPGMYRVFGLEPRTTGFTWEEYASFIHPDDLESANKNVQIMLHSSLNHRERFDYRIIQHDGSVHIIRSQRQVVGVDAEGKVTVVVGVDQDVTEQKQAEDQIQQYSRHLEELVAKRTRQLQDKERLAAIGATAGMVGHDIRNPLQALTGEVYLIKTELTDMPPNQTKQNIIESLDSIEQGISYINKIIADLQDYSRPLKPEFQKVNLENLISEVIKTITFPSNIKLLLKIKPLPEISIEHTFTKRVLTNLINNAIQAMPNGGQLKITTCQENDCICIIIADSGVGIPEELKAKIFSPMFTTKAKGQGLGLAVVKRLVEAQGGSIGFKSKVGVGTKFQIKLPIYPP